jgi:hypothetical protein
MADPAQAIEGGPGPQAGIVARLAATVARHSYAALAAIVALTIIVAALFVYYRGVLFLGPYAKPAGAGSGAGAGAGGAAAAGDAETERLIDTINRGGAAPAGGGNARG